jgi:hypothetical protein
MHTLCVSTTGELQKSIVVVSVSTDWKIGEMAIHISHYVKS